MRVINKDAHNILKKLALVSSKLKKQDHSWLNLLKKKQRIKGVYLFGSVGSGKTTIMRGFAAELEQSHCKLLHFGKFLTELRQDLHQEHRIKAKNPLAKIVKNYKKHFKYLFIDEFECASLADISLFCEILPLLLKNDFFIFLNSNSLPNDSGSTPHMRDRAKFLLNIIEQNFDVLHLDSARDYRLVHKRSIKPRIIEAKDGKILHKMLLDFCSYEQLGATTIKVWSRDFKFARAYDKILYSNFNELFLSNLSNSDFLVICQRFKVIFIEDIRSIDASEENVATRFINFIDNAYFNKVILYTNLLVPINEIYKNGRLQKKFTRAISRLHEMSSDHYKNNTGD